MFLKRLDLYGFKSFADKTGLIFEPGITAIVGPNGSGKSNITDAIRWVLGEQSAKQLRGQIMEDFIFAGSDGRRPLNYAEVRLTIDNGDGALPVDYSEVTVARRVYRDGTSEYLLNGGSCLLRDIVDLFSDTGIGKQGYSIIGQGEIHELLSSKPADRRGFFEEVAGIVRFKNRKREAERKLEGVTHDLLRVEDIMVELESQLGPLGQQAEVARLYKQYRSELRDLEVRRHLEDLIRAQRRLDRSRRRSAELSESLAEVTAELRDSLSRLDKEKDHLRGGETQLEAFQQSLLDRERERGQLDSRIKLLNERIGNWQEDIARIDSQVDDFQKKLMATGASLTAETIRQQGLEGQIDAETKVARDKEAEFQELNEVLNREETVVEGLKGDVLDLLNEMSQRKNEISGLERENEGFDQRLERLKREAAQSDEEKQGLEQEIAGLEVSLQEVLGKAKAARQRLSENEKELGRRREAEKQLATSISRVRDSLRGCESRLTLLQEMEESYEGYHRGVRSVLLAKKDGNRDLTGIEGSVAELLSVPTEYGKAIEVALGAALQNIIVSEEQVARNAIQYLKKGKAGRATFLPLDVIRPMPPRDYEVKSLEDQGAVGFAIDLVQFAEKYRPALAYLLGRVIVAADLDAAMRIGRGIGFRSKIVTLEGEILHPGGSITGGHLGHNAQGGLLVRAQEMERLGKDVKRLRGSLDKQEAASNRLATDIEGLSSNIAALQEEIRSSEHRHGLLERDLAQAQQSHSRCQNAIEVSGFEISQLDRTRERNVTQVAELRQELLILGERTGQLRTQIDDISSGLQDQKDRREHTQAELTEIKVALASLKQEAANVSRNLVGLKQRDAEIRSDVESGKARKELLLGRIEQAGEELSQLKSDIESVQKRVVEIEAAREEWRERVSQVRQSIQEVEGAIEQHRATEDEIGDKLNRANVREASVASEVESIVSRLSEEHGLSQEEVWLQARALQEPEDEAAAEVMARVTWLKEHMEELGDVNLGAIEEYERLSERHQLLMEQSADLRVSESELTELIREIEKKMVERFRESFSRINEEFKKVFVKLFGGGQAALVLDDDSNLLETGIEVIAQPPGKKRQSLSLLSGGERALTAIALIMSALEIKPAPFVLFDEIDASLDDNNIVGFASYIKNASERCQFIIITHQKGTMEVTDSLYGTTMEEEGVSKLVSVRLAHGREQAS